MNRDPTQKLIDMLIKERLRLGVEVNSERPGLCGHPIAIARLAEFLNSIWDDAIDCWTEHTW